MQWRQARLRPGELATVPLRTRYFWRWRNVLCRNRPLQGRTADAHALAPGVFRSPPWSHPSSPRPDRSGRFFRSSLPFQCRLQHRRQLFATHGSPPQNTQTRLRTQIVFWGHRGLQNLRQGRCVFSFGVRPTTARQKLDTRRSIRFPDNNLHRASLFCQAQAPRRTVP